MFSKESIAESSVLCDVRKYLSAKCSMCQKTFSSKRRMQNHMEKCVDQRTCRHCAQVFSSLTIARSHQNICESVSRSCSHCNKMFNSDSNLSAHEYQCSLRSKKRKLLQIGGGEASTSSTSQSSKRPRVMPYYCRQCNEGFMNRGDLWRHRQTQHGGAADLQNFQATIDDEEVRQEYEANRPFILAPTRQTRDNAVYNFPTNDLQDGFDEMRNHLNEIYENEVNAYKLNLSFGLILKNSATQKLRYFVPHSNETLFNTSQAISSRRDLARVMQRIENIDVQDHLQNLKDNSEWKVQMITNINYNVTPTNFALGAPVVLPKFILQHHSLIPLTCKSNGVPYDDNLCMFRALYYHKYKLLDEMGVLALFQTWKDISKCKSNAESFHGVKFSEIPLFEDTFNVGVNMYDMQSHSSAIPRYLTQTTFGDVMCVNIFEGHISYVIDARKFISKFICQTCHHHFSRERDLRVHLRTCTGGKSMRFPGKFLSPPSTIFETLEQYDIVVPVQDRKTEYFCTFDFESILLHKDIKLSEKIVISHVHVPVSWAIKSNVPGFENTVFNCSNDLDALIAKMIEYLTEMSAACEAILRERYAEAFKILQNKLSSIQSMSSKNRRDARTGNNENIEPNCDENCTDEKIGFDFDSSDNESSEDENSDSDEMASFINDSVNESDGSEQYPNPYLHAKSFARSESDRTKELKADSMQFVRKKLQRTLDELNCYCKRLVVLGFNSESYDLPLIMQTLVKHLNLHTKDSFCVKKGSKYKCIQNESFKFLDIRNYISANCTYDQFIKAYGSGGAKSFWPYEWFDDYQKLEQTYLPCKESFYSELKKCNVLGNDENEIEANYKTLQELWVKKEMKCMRDLLEHYNTVDVEYFVGAVENMLQYYFEENVDLFKTTISLPNYARNLVFRSVDVAFPLFDRTDSDLYKMYRASSAGGPSIVFNRYACRDKSFIRNNPDKPVKSIIGWDMNNMYGYAIAQEMPTSIYIQYHAETGFRAEPCTRYMDQFFWLDYVAETENIHITHKMNNQMKEVRIANLFCDGFSMSNGHLTVYEYDSNRFHFNCPHCPTILSENEKTREFQLRARSRTISKRAYLESLGIRVVTMHECYFKKNIKPNIRHIIDRYMPENFKPGKRFSSESAILKAVQNHKLFGAIYCDIEVPEKWSEQSGCNSFSHDLSPAEYFSEMSPIFCVSDIEAKDFGEHMTQFCNEANFKPTKRRLLIGGMKAEKILLSTSLLKWYLEHGMKISKIYRVVQFTPRKCFASFVEKGTAMRRLGDSCPDKKILAEKYKLQINSLFGSFLRNKEKERSLVFVNSSHKLRLKANDPSFVRATELSPGNFEVEHVKKHMCLNNPVYLGHTILNKAKELLLDFYYSFLDYYFERKDFMLMCSDTDSAFVALSSDNFEDLVKPHLREEFQRRVYGSCHLDRIRPDAGFFLTRKCCEQHSKFDAREPGLWKTEATGTEMLCLSSKTYLLAENDMNIKMSCKGANKRAVIDPLQTFRNVLFDKKTGEVENRGIRNLQGKISTYRQKRNSFHYFYVKRTVLEDGNSTKPLCITLTPWSNSFIVIDANHPLSLNHIRTFKFEGKSFLSTRQLVLYKHALYKCEKPKALAILNCPDIRNYYRYKISLIEYEEWSEAAIELLNTIIKEKHKQWAINDDYFMQYKNKNIIAAGWDRFWECGMEKRLAEVSNSQEFRGKNNLGKLIQAYALSFNV